MKATNPNHKKNLVNFKKGKDERRNLKGRPKTLPSLNEILINVMGEEKSNGETYAQIIVKALREKAAKGDVRAAEVLLERMFGKVRQELDHNVRAEHMIAKVEIIKIIRDDGNGKPGTTDTTETNVNDTREL